MTFTAINSPKRLNFSYIFTLYAVFWYSGTKTALFLTSNPPSPLHFQSSAWPGGTAAGGGASGALSGQAAAHSLDTPRIKRKKETFSGWTQHKDRQPPWSALQHRGPRDDHVTHLIPHVRLIVEARRRAEDLAVRVHELQLVSPDVHGVHRPLQQVQTLVARSLQAVLCRQVGSQGARKACVVAEVATLETRG